MIVSVVVGLALLFFGRQLFWLFVGGAGFAAGMAVAGSWFGGRSEGLVLTLAALAGFVGAVLSILLQRFMIGVAGFLAGAYALADLAAKLGRNEWAWVAGLLGGVIGAILVLVLFDWALIGLSALTGALLVADSIRLSPSAVLVALVVLFVMGVLVQAAQLRRQAPAPPAARET